MSSRKLTVCVTSGSNPRPPSPSGAAWGLLESWMIDFLEKDNALTFKVRVVPRASRSEIVGEHDGALRVRIAAPPVDGAANEELLRTLARAFKLPSSAIEIIAGHTAKLKTVRAVDLKPDALATVLRVRTRRGDTAKS